MYLREVRKVAILGGSRSPFARSDGPYATASDQEMLTAAFGGLVERYGLRGPGAVGEFAAGAVLKHSRDFTLARETAARLRSRPPYPRLRHPAGLRHGTPGGRRRARQLLDAREGPAAG